MSSPLEPLDSHGNVIAEGAGVRVPNIPEWLVRDLPNEEVIRLRAMEGAVMRVLEIDKHGYLWFGENNEGRWFCLRPDEVTVVAAA